MQLCIMPFRMFIFMQKSNLLGLSSGEEVSDPEETSDRCSGSTGRNGGNRMGSVRGRLFVSGRGACGALFGSPAAL